MSDKTDIVEVEIFGQKYAIRGDGNPEYARQLARYVDERMRAAAKKCPPGFSAQKVAVMTALNMADELQRLKRRQSDVEEMIKDKTGDLFDLLKDE